MERVIGIDELQPGERRSVFVDDIPALVIRLQDQFFVIEDMCSHDGQPLDDGVVGEFSITCPRHSARFDLRTGSALCMPATSPIRVFRTEIRNEAVWAAPPAISTGTRPSADISPPVTQVSGAPASPPSADAPSPDPAAEVKPSTASDLIEALRQVVDPELMINIVDLGLVYAVNHDDRKVRVEMTLTSPACPAGPQIIQQAKMALERLHDIDEAIITITMSPPWTPNRMTDEAKDQLGIF
jgi:metal-sulfur cluster biosynthetic enzyme/nitrite reductase/ring-hydroxylating ferredoxin subunit